MLGKRTASESAHLERIDPHGVTAKMVTARDTRPRLTLSAAGSDNLPVGTVVTGTRQGDPFALIKADDATWQNAIIGDGSTLDLLASDRQFIAARVLHGRGKFRAEVGTVVAGRSGLYVAVRHADKWRYNLGFDIRVHEQRLREYGDGQVVRFGYSSRTEGELQDFYAEAVSWARSPVTQDNRNQAMSELRDALARGYLNEAEVLYRRELVEAAQTQWDLSQAYEGLHHAGIPLSAPHLLQTPEWQLYTGASLEDLRWSTWNLRVGPHERVAALGRLDSLAGSGAVTDPVEYEERRARIQDAAMAGELHDALRDVKAVDTGDRGGRIAWGAGFPADSAAATRRPTRMARLLGRQSSSDTASPNTAR